MRLKQEGSTKSYYYLKKMLYFFLKYFFNKKTKIISLLLVIIATFLIGIISGLLIFGFFGTINEPSQRALDVLHTLGINNMRQFKSFFIDNILAENIKIPINYIKGQFSRTEKISIDISFENYQRLSYKREQALEKGILFSSPEDYVPTTIMHGNKKVRADLRLKGDATDHFDTNKWSFRIIVKGSDTIFGMKRFSIQHPKTRAYIYDWFVHKALEREGIITLRFDFIDVTVNGKHKGIYAIEEFFDKILIENNKFREGPIIKFNEDTIWRRYLQGSDFSEILPDSYFNIEIDSFQTNTLEDDPVKLKQYLKAKDLLESFREGKLPAHKVFDMDKLARFIAFLDVMGGYFGLSYNNMRFYYNPITSLLEPIAYDIGNPTDIYTVAYHYDNEGWYPFRDTLFADKLFTKKYFEELKRVSEQEYLDDLFSDLDKEIKEKLNIIHSEYPYVHFSKKIFYNNQKVIRNFLNPIKGLQAYIKHIDYDKNVLILEIANIQGMPIEILNIEYKNKSFPLNQEYNYLESKSPSSPLTYETFEFKLPQRIDSNNLSDLNIKINYNLLGDSKVRNEGVFPWPHLYEKFLETDFIRVGPNIEDYGFLDIDKINKKIFIKKGNWILNNDLIIPKDFTVFGEGGTTIDLRNNTMILSYSNFKFSGSKENPIKITSSDKTGQGVTILNSEEESYLEYVSFNDLSSPSKNNWELFGAVNFYRSPVRFNNVLFSGTISEDSLNIISSEFEIRDSRFENSLSDCLDIDFGSGLIISSSFNNCGNDGLDLSGSIVVINNVIVSNVGDKGLSIGEKSNISSRNLKIDNSYIGVVSKDLSHIYINTIQISDSEYGFSAYQKKSEFGPAEIIANDSNIYNTKNKYFIEKNSILSFNEEIIIGDQKNVYEKLYCGERKC